MISVVIPCYNEEEVLPQLFARLGAAAETWGEEYEILLVDDGSRDATWQLILEQHARDERWRGISFARNFGHQTAISAGIHYARGCAVILMDADLQDPPEQIESLIAAWKKGYEVVYAVRATRKENIAKRAAFRTFYQMLHSLAEIDIPLDSGLFSLMDRRVVNVLKAMPERNRFVPGLRSWAGFRQIGIEFDRGARAAGEVKNTLSRLTNLALDGMISFSTLPLRMATYLGFAVAFAAFLGAAFTLVKRIFVDWFAKMGFPFVQGFSSLFIGMLFLGGVQLICLGILGEYLGRIYEEVKGRPLWTIRETAGLEMDAPK
ncbi:MAG TPA: glycosyltransferase family 2 protein [Candidatus Latescibacteria bacterium]|nr:glycosyltransferase family 2 protein [Candidatus Latescibacterota bacterium]HPK75634.1 glycosyltransferase family 2 protein [Candidatus Latescibacterota bacterium]